MAVLSAITSQFNHFSQRGERERERKRENQMETKRNKEKEKQITFFSKTLTVCLKL